MYTNITLLPEGTAFNLYWQTFKTLQNLYFDIDIKIKSPRDSSYRSFMKHTINFCELMKHATSNQIIQQIFQQLAAKIEALQKCPINPVFLFN